MRRWGFARAARAPIFRLGLAAIADWIASGPLPAAALDAVRFGANWVAQPEHGGFYQALADGTYRKYGLDVTIVPGGRNVNNASFCRWASSTSS